MRPEFAREITLSPPLATAFAATRARNEAAGQTLDAIAGL
jgi:hypothetical protein